MEAQAQWLEITWAYRALQPAVSVHQVEITMVSLAVLLAELVTV